MLTLYFTISIESVTVFIGTLPINVKNLCGGS